MLPLLARVQFWHHERIVPLPKWVDRYLYAASIVAVVWTWL
jgi:hypothetical protein